LHSFPTRRSSDLRNSAMRTTKLAASSWLEIFQTRTVSRPKAGSAASELGARPGAPVASATATAKNDITRTITSEPSFLEVFKRQLGRILPGHARLKKPLDVLSQN